MTVGLIATTFVGAFIFPFVIRLLWGHLEKTYGPIGGIMAALFIVGVIWTLNHGFVGTSGNQAGLIYQAGAWVDMGLAAGVGLIVASMARGAKFDNHTSRNVAGAIVGGLLAGLLLAIVNVA